MVVRNLEIANMMKILEDLSKKCKKVDIELDLETNQVIFYPVYKDETKTDKEAKDIDLSDITKLV
jgi:hypothetical protein